jgi:hypothetical protein
MHKLYHCMTLPRHLQSITLELFIAKMINHIKLHINILNIHTFILFGSFLPKYLTNIFHFLTIITDTLMLRIVVNQGSITKENSQNLK